ncbi:transcription termination/antitermination protein NusA [Methylophaga marina]|uniref:Transcription termination/antitermination protein NusA n=1 Tax=Methylophaga marina TaxID=45495 RepID=A0ABN0T7V8_9GAMM|nr:transcription termination factor NusA [Methylophaga marina]BDZ72948.1 transcription termination/antitermination protein NusA [Methylophaga marina]
MNNKEILLVVDAMSNEKGVGKEVIFQAIEAALAMATRKRYDMALDAHVQIDRVTGNYETFRQWLIVEDEDYQSPETEITIDDAQESNPDAVVGEYVREPMESVEFGRIAAQTAKQVIVQKVREAERAQVVDQYREKVGQMIHGTVKRVERGNVTLDLGGNAEAFLPREEMIPRESFRTGDRIRGYLKEIRPEGRGPQLIVSRVAPELLIELFRLEVPEISDGMIEVKGAARDAGLRAKIAVLAKESRIDPVGACVGMRGSRVQAVTNELAGERVDIILWDEDVARFAINAMAPAEVLSIVVDEDAHSMDIAVEDAQLSQAIGRGGQNVRLASQLTGWELNVMSASDADKKAESEIGELIKTFMADLDVDEDVALILAQEGFSSLEEVAYVPEHEMLDIEEFDADIVAELRSRARDVLLTRAIASEEQLESAEPTQELINMEGMTRDLALTLGSKGITDLDDLAELAVDELVEIGGMEEQQAAALIMKARESWFANEQTDAGE